MIRLGWLRHQSNPTVDYSRYIRVYARLSGTRVLKSLANRVGVSAFVLARVYTYLPPIYAVNIAISRSSHLGYENSGRDMQKTLYAYDFSESLL